MKKITDSPSENKPPSPKISYKQPALDAFSHLSGFFIGLLRCCPNEDLHQVPKDLHQVPEDLQVPSNEYLPGAKSWTTKLDEDRALITRGFLGCAARGNKKDPDLNASLDAHYVRPLPYPILCNTISAHFVALLLSAEQGTFASRKLGPDKFYPLTAHLFSPLTIPQLLY